MSDGEVLKEILLWARALGVAGILGIFSLAFGFVKLSTKFEEHQKSHDTLWVKHDELSKEFIGCRTDKPPKCTSHVASTG